MVSSVGPKGHQADNAGAGHAPKTADREMPPQARNAQSVGHLAKAAVVLSGDTSPNAVGKAASLIARHVLDTAPAEEPPVEEPPVEDPAVEETATGEGAATPPVTTTPEEDQAAALLLLAEEPR